MDIFDGLLREALVVCAVICLPMLGAAALVGTLIAIVQAATQVQEQTPFKCFVGLYRYTKH